MIFNGNIPNRSVQDVSKKKDILKIVSEDSLGTSISIKVDINLLTLGEDYSKAGKYNLFKLIPQKLVCKISNKISAVCARKCFYESEPSCSIHNIRNELKNCAQNIVENKCLALRKIPTNTFERGIEIDLLPRHAQVGDDTGVEAVSAVETECI